MGRKNEWIKEDKIEDLRKEWIMGMYINGRFMVGAYPLLIPNAKGQSQSLGARSTEMEGGSKDPCHTWYAWAHIRWGHRTRDPLQTQLYDEC